MNSSYLTISKNQRNIKTINKFLLKNLKVDFTFLNLVNNKNLYDRLKKRKSLNRYDKFNQNFYQKVQEGFLKLSKKNTQKIGKVMSYYCLYFLGDKNIGTEHRITS